MPQSRLGDNKGAHHGQIAQQTDIPEEQCQTLNYIHEL